MRSITGRVSGTASMQIGTRADGESDGDGGECVEVPFLSVAARDPADTGECHYLRVFYSRARIIWHKGRNNDNSDIQSTVRTNHPQLKLSLGLVKGN